MLAGVPQAGGVAMMGQHLLIERGDQLTLMRKRQGRFALSRCEIASELTGKPRGPPGATPDHDRIRAGGAKRGVGILEGLDVTVDDERDRYRLLDGSHRGPVGAPVVELTAGTAVHADETDADLL